MSDDFSIGGEVEKFPYVTLKKEGDEVEGTILKREMKQAYSYVDDVDRAAGEKSEPLFWSSKGKQVTDDTGNPVMNIVLTLEVDDKDEPVQVVFIKGRLFTAFKEYAAELGKPVNFEEGARVKIRRGPGEKRQVQYRVKLTPPTVSIGADTTPVASSKDKEEVPF